MSRKDQVIENLQQENVALQDELVMALSELDSLRVSNENGLLYIDTLKNTLDIVSTPDVEAEVLTVPVNATIDSIIARELMRIDQNSDVELDVQDMLDLSLLKLED